MSAIPNRGFEVCRRGLSPRQGSGGMSEGVRVNARALSAPGSGLQLARGQEEVGGGHGVFPGC